MMGGMGTSEILSSDDTAAELADSPFEHVEDRVRAEFATADFASAVHLLDRVALLADAMNHHPDVELGWGRVAFELTSHDAGGVTMRDLTLAERIAVIANEQGAQSA